MPNTVPAIGIHMNGSKIEFAVVQGRNILMRAESMSTSDHPNPESVITEIGDRLLALKQVMPSVKAIGMGLTGFTDSKAGTVHSLTKVAGWHDIPIRRILAEISGLPSYIDNDAHCATYAEWKLGAGQEYDDLVFLLLNQGIGSGIVSGGHFLRGRHGTAGELGQSSISYSGRIGHYGNRGALENYLGTQTIARDARIAYAAAGIQRSIDKCQVASLAQSAKENCPIALKIWDNIAMKLSTCMVNCNYLLNPEAFILGGELSLVGEPLFAPLRRHLKHQLFFAHYEDLQILPAEFGEEAGLIGAAKLALDELNHDEQG